MTDKTGGPAFPTSTQITQDASTGHTVTHQYLSDGMTLRDYFAAMALMGFSARELPNHSHALVAALSYDAADAMIAERTK